MSAKVTGARTVRSDRWSASKRRPLTLACSVLFLAVFLAGSALGQVCDTGDECSIGMCGADGECHATPVQDGTACSGPTSTCVASYTCQSGICTATPANDGLPCTPDSVCATSGICTSGICQGIAFAPPGTTCEINSGLGLCYPGECMFSFCIPGNIVNCTPSDKCTYSFCNPQTGQCQSFGKCSFPQDCQGNTCDPATGTCNVINEGGACNDFNECTNPDTCHGGLCMGTAGGGGATPTFTPTVKATSTRTPTTKPTNTPTVKPSPTPTTKPTPTATPTATVLAMPHCVGDCNNDETVAINEVVVCVNIFLENASLSTCPNADQDGNGSVAINEVVGAVNSFLDASTCPKVAADSFNPGGQ